MIQADVILWDWNGTLLNDTETCLTTMNRMLQHRKMPKLTLDLYKEVFGFPVIDYYRKIGFDFNRESFEDLSVEFIDAYTKALWSAPLSKSAKDVLAYYKSIGKQNIIISAMKHDMLVQSVIEKGLIEYFDEILGIDTIYAASKSVIASDFVHRNSIPVDNVILIGDTTHDYEVAEELGCKCILIADGHQSEERLRAIGAEIVSSLADLLPAF
jgi:phosphoglycolate phosphatase